MLLARIYGAFQLACPVFLAEMRIIAFISEAATVKKTLDHIGVPQPPRISRALSILGKPGRERLSQRNATQQVPVFFTRGSNNQGVFRLFVF